MGVVLFCLGQIEERSLDMLLLTGVLMMFLGSRRSPIEECLVMLLILDNRVNKADLLVLVIENGIVISEEVET